MIFDIPNHRQTFLACRKSESLHDMHACLGDMQHLLWPSRYSYISKVYDLLKFGVAVLMRTPK